MCVAAYTGHALESEVEELGFEPCLVEEGDEERSKTAVNVERDVALQCKSGERGYIIDDAMREIGC